MPGRPPAYPELAESLFAAAPPSLENVVLVADVDSTNGLARRVATELVGQGIEVRPSLIVAYGQNRGRGRLGHGWQSPPGLGVYATLLLPLTAEQDLASFPLATAVALATSLNARLRADRVRLKWPNDLMVDGAKLGGLLLEALPAGESPGALLVGFGINVVRGDRALGERKAVSLQQIAAVTLPPLGDLVAELTRDLLRELAGGADRASVRARYAALSIHSPGEALRCRLGGDTLEGRFAGFDHRGHLRLEVGGEERLISAGEIIDP